MSFSLIQKKSLRICQTTSQSTVTKSHIMHLAFCLYSFFSLFLMQSKCHSLILRTEVSNDCYTYLKKVTCFCVTSVLCWGWYEGSLFFTAVTSTNSSFIHGEATSCQCQPQNPLSKILIDNFILSSVKLHSSSQSSAFWPDGMTFLFVWMCFVQHGSLLHWKPQSRTSCQHQILCKVAE